ncbi:protein LEKR1 isoform X2 [Betta splendens]|uniref:Protein LEKR1 isoform X2 n=1 Tax=Betta splendens TaxID=158456 RepID=A0A9W2Y866_BETSP|nr:protein LEKR1 isoform X2 [Betta splendens]
MDRQDANTRKMEHSETVCHYCGVSYLIFHEFQQLHTRLAQQEAELQELRGTAQRERAQRDALELEKQEWERTLHLEVLRRAAENEKRMSETLEEKSKETESALRKAFDEKSQRERRELEQHYQKLSEERQTQLRGELRDLEAESLRKQREELQRRTDERERALSDALQKANKNVEEQKKYLRHLEERLTAATSTKEDAEQLLGEQKQMGETLRAACSRQQRALEAALPALRSTGGELSDVRGLLHRLMEAWQRFRAQMLQCTTQVFSALRKELKNSSEEVQKMREDYDRVTQQLTCLQKQKGAGDEKLSQLELSEEAHRQQLLRFKAELEEKHEMWLSCQQKRDAIQEQLLSWQQREEQMARKCSSAEQEVMQLRKTLERLQEKTTELSTEREGLLESHRRELIKIEEDFGQQMASKLTAALEEQSTQNALHLREQMTAYRGEVELELSIDREKNRLLLLQHQRHGSRLQHKLEEREQELQELRAALQQERRSREEERRMQQQERRRAEEETRQEMHRFQQQEALKLSHIEAELQLMTGSNTELQGEVAVLQETVRRECEEREELTAALSKAQEELLGLRSPVSCPRSLPSPPERHTPRSKHFLQSQTRVPLTRSSASPNTLRSFSSCVEKDRSLDTGGARAVGGSESWNCAGVLGGGKKQKGTLPRLKVSSSATEVKLG